MARNLGLHLGVTVSLFATTLVAATITVPAEQPTIQAGINAAKKGDAVVVSPGTYTENINFMGKAITVKSSSGAKLTIIDGGQNGSVVTFSSGESAAAVLMGFTVQNGTGTINFGLTEGGGIYIANNSAPTIVMNTISQNHACDGGGIAINSGSSPLIQHNVITKNSGGTCGGLGGGGIAIHGAGAPQIIANTISNNTECCANGGGIYINYTTQVPLIENNLIRNNVAATGGGIYAANQVYNSLLIQNLITRNTASQGAGMYWTVVNNSFVTMVNNTIALNTINQTCPLCEGSALYIGGFYGQSVLENNLFIAQNSQSALFCDSLYSSTPPLLNSNDAYSVGGGTAFGDGCSGQGNTNGNISSDPQFVSSSNFRLKGGSSAIDAGSNTAPDLPNTDLAGNPRIIIGNGGPTAIVDIGAYEFAPVVLSPKSLAFGLQAVGSHTSKMVELTNAQDKLLNIPTFSVPTGYSVSGCGTSVAPFKTCTLTVTFHPLTAGTFKGTLTVKDDAGNSPQTVPLSGSAH